MEIWVHRNGQYAGRFSESEIEAKIADGSLSANDLAWDREKALWKPLGEFLATLKAANQASAPSPPAAAPKEPAQDPSTPAVEAKPVGVRRFMPPPPPSMPTPTVAYEPVRAAGPPPLPVA